MKMLRVGIDERQSLYADEFPFAVTKTVTRKFASKACQPRSKEVNDNESVEVPVTVEVEVEAVLDVQVEVEVEVDDPSKPIESEVLPRLSLGNLKYSSTEAQ